MGLKNIKSARFYIKTGPDSLFERVAFKMRNDTKLRLHGTHFAVRKRERNIPQLVIEKIENFSVYDWKLVMCEVRVDTGKFINSTWEYIFDGVRYWITIGFNNVVETVIRKESKSYDNIVKHGEFFDFVSQVNRELMNDEVVN